ncbi:hypothetical protein NSB25_07470 [Acetatifactor muris]|uniref:Uncharacterized protein n=1 Tax=Acetatifactor muris TaxID=879566 RepID=A0A2K4ZE44_9FIRM|nr:hypothetical protein [Acetatifactor muris]MCR2047113.1 hypothetical protein [Acetatifactor muris]SOY28720.1 hypothetical protein AMURIS_01431 [Acetatifactor muris]
MKYITFPWEQLGGFLRSLSLSGSAGNIAAWILFIVTGALPLALCAVLAVRHKIRRADVLLPVLAVVLYAALWFYTNPSYMDLYLSPIPTEGFSRYSLAAAIDCTFLTWLLLRFLHNTEKPERRRLLTGLQILLSLYALILAAGSLWQNGTAFIAARQKMEEMNTAADRMQLNISTVFLMLQALTDLFPAIAEAILLILTAAFIGSFAKAPFGAGTFSLLEKLKKASGQFLILILLTNLGLTLLQLLFSGYILSSSYLLLFPLTEIIVVLGIRLLTLLYLDGKRLKEDNDMII